MTAFARYAAQGAWGNAIWELRSVNHRYLEINLRLPELISSLEPKLREQLKNYLQRGKVEVSLRYQPSANQAVSLTLNQPLLNQLLQACSGIKSALPKDFSLAPLDGVAILAWPGIVNSNSEMLPDLEHLLLESFTQAIMELVQVRQREGSSLLLVINQRLVAMEAEIRKIQEELPRSLIQQRTKLLDRFAEAKSLVDANRLEQELVLFAQKIDIAEEVDRLTLHVNEFQRILQQTGANGRRLDFLLQELNREANTLAAKAVNPTITLAAVELKVLIEQIREQVQNIE